jgi:hypothetical protein
MTGARQRSGLRASSRESIEPGLPPNSNERFALPVVNVPLAKADAGLAAVLNGALRR